MLLLLLLPERSPLRLFSFLCFYGFDAVDGRLCQRIKTFRSACVRSWCMGFRCALTPRSSQLDSSPITLAIVDLEFL